MSCVDHVNGSEVALVVTRGDTMRFRVELQGVGKAPVDVTGWGWLCQLRTDPEDTALVVIVVEVVDAAAGVLALSLDPTVTAALPVRDYVWDLQGTDEVGDVRTVLEGRLRIREDVTR